MTLNLHVDWLYCTMVYRMETPPGNDACTARIMDGHGQATREQTSPVKGGASCYTSAIVSLIAWQSVWKSMLGDKRHQAHFFLNMHVVLTDSQYGIARCPIHFFILDPRIFLYLGDHCPPLPSLSVSWKMGQSRALYNSCSRKSCRPSSTAKVSTG